MVHCINPVVRLYNKNPRYLRQKHSENFVPKNYNIMVATLSLILLKKYSKIQKKGIPIELSPPGQNKHTAESLLS